MGIISYIGIAFLIILFVLSVWGNIYLIKRLLYINENLYGVLGSLDDYLIHLKDVYSKDRFYGDETLHDLLEHSQGMGEELENFIGKYEQLYAKAPPAQE